MNKTFKYRIYPTDEQKVFINKTIGCCRQVYNELLADCNKQYAETGKSKVPSYKIVRDKYDYMKEVDSQALNQAARHLEDAFTNFFESCKGTRKDKVSYPQFKHKNNSGSYTTYISKCKDNSHYFNKGKLVLPKIKEGITVVWHRKLEGQIKHITISRTPSGEYYASICTKVPYDLPTVTEKESPKVVGIDMALDCLAVYSDGTSAEMPHMYRNIERKLKKAQRSLSRKIGFLKGEEKSKNFLKQQKRVAKIYRDMTNARKDFLDNESLRISESFDVVVLEDINLKAIASSKSKKKPKDNTETPVVNNNSVSVSNKKRRKKIKHGKSVSEISFGEFRQMIGYKMARNGKKVVKAPRQFPSSQLCSNCGFKNIETKQYWKVKSWTCPECGIEHNLVINGVQHGRDYNAAKNLQQYYLDNPENITDN